MKGLTTLVIFMSTNLKGAIECNDTVFKLACESQLTEILFKLIIIIIIILLRLNFWLLLLLEL